MQELDEIFGPAGPLVRALPGFRVRRQQLAMANRVAEALERRETLAVEAGTGTGKTFAYLVPVLLSGARVLISTGTRTLQDQLFAKDLPLLAGAIGRPSRVALLKGRSNYLCRHRLNEAAEGAQQLALGEPAPPEPVLRRIRSWARTTRRGDLAELTGLSDSHPIWPRVTSTRENCLGPACPEWSGCHVAAARREALDADVVIVNHHLLMADLALKEYGFGDLLGSADAVILDEAHQIPDLATQFFGAHVSSRRIEALLEEIETAGSCDTDLGARARDVAESLRQVGECVPARIGRAAWVESPDALEARVGALAVALNGLRAHLEAAEEAGTLAGFAPRAGELAQSLERLSAIDELEGARAIERTPRGFALSLMPFDISQRFSALIEARRSAWVFTSATLSLGEDFSHFAARLGLGAVPTLRIESPFDYETQCLMYLPTGLPEPASDSHVPAVMQTAAALIAASGGGAFVLFTSHRALGRGAAWLREHCAGLASAGRSPPRLLVQGEEPRERLLTEFREDGNAVLLGTTSFWEGVDVKGDALRLVVIEKLPFASPEDPLVRARIDHLQARGGNPFRDFQLPEAALALKQGVGRLIRSEEDFGVVAICDPRITARGYGRVFFGALPTMTVTRDADEAARFLRRHSPVPDKSRPRVS